MTDQMTQAQKVTTTSAGKTIEIPLEDWAMSLISKALHLHKIECPWTQSQILQAKLDGAVDKRLARVEIYQKVIIGALCPVYLWMIAYFLNSVSRIVEAVRSNPVSICDIVKQYLG